MLCKYHAMIRICELLEASLGGPYFRVGETETRRNEAACLRSHSWEGAELGITARALAPHLLFLPSVSSSPNTGAAGLKAATTLFPELPSTTQSALIQCPVSLHNVALTLRAREAHVW